MRFILLFFSFLAAATVFAAPLKLAENGKTAYSIIVPANASGVDKFAARELAFFLKECILIQSKPI